MVGDALLLDQRFDALPAGVVAQQFGDQFAATLGAVPIGQWHGPVASGYGVHLVFVSARTDSHLPALEDVREAVRREWANAQRVERDEKFYQTLLQRYTVTIERPTAGAGDGAHHTHPEVAMRRWLAILVLVLALRARGARSAPGLSPDPSDGVDTYEVLWKVRDAVRPCGWVSTSNCRRIAPDSASRERHSSTTPLPNAGA